MFGWKRRPEPGTVEAYLHQGLDPSDRVSAAPDGRWVFTSDTEKPRLAVIDTATNKVDRWIALPGTGYGTAPTPDGKWLLVAIPTTNAVAVVDIATNGW